MRIKKIGVFKWSGGVFVFLFKNIWWGRGVWNDGVWSGDPHPTSHSLSIIPVFTVGSVLFLFSFFCGCGLVLASPHIQEEEK